MKPERLFKIVKFYVPFYLPIDTLIKRVPKLGPILAALIPIPCYNYLGMGLNRGQRVEWAILDTFDALGARYDSPKTQRAVETMVASPENLATDVFYGRGGAIVANVLKR
jgi:hypothetical protein